MPKNKIEKRYLTLAMIGLWVYLLASPGFYMDLGMNWHDLTNLFNPSYDRQSLGFKIDSSNPIFQVMRTVSSIGLIALIVGLIGMCVVRVQNKNIK